MAGLLKGIIDQEVLGVKSIIKNDIQEGDIKLENLEEILIEINEGIDSSIFSNLKYHVKFNLFSSDGNYYKSMLGKGENIPYSDLYEILKRLYHYHHIFQTFTLEFEEYTIEINYKNLDENTNISRLVMSAIGNGEYLKVSDFL